MRIEKIVDRELTAQEIASIKKFRSYTDGVSFACLRERVMVMLPDEPSKDPQTLKEKALEAMCQALSVHPDFTVYRMQDNHLLLFLESGIFTFTAEPCRESMGVNLMLRGECLDAAQKMEVIAVAYEED
jgi:hypothetical protein